MGAIFSLLAGAASLALKVWGWFTTSRDEKIGADAQTGRDNAAAAKTEAAIAQAEADAPRTDAEVDQVLKEHRL